MTSPARFAQEFGRTLSRMTLYPMKHPLVKESIQESHEILTDIFSQQEEITLGFLEGKLIGEGAQLEVNAVAFFALESVFKRFEVDSLTFSRGISNGELVTFFKFISNRLITDPKGGLQKLLSSEIQHIKINQTYFTKVTKDQTGTAEKPQIGGAGIGEGGFKGSGGSGEGMGPGTGGSGIGERGVSETGEGFGPGQGVGTGGSGTSGGMEGIEAGGGGGDSATPGPAPGEGTEKEPGIEPSWFDKLLQMGPEEIVREVARRAGANETQLNRLTRTFSQTISKNTETKIAEVTQVLRGQNTQLTNTMERTQAVISNVADGVVVVDDQGRVLMMNPTAEKIYGVKLGDQLGKSLLENTKKEQMVALAKELSTPADRPISKDVDLKSSDDTMKTLRASSALVQKEDGKVVGMVSVLPDVTKQKELNQLQSDIISTVTHELRSPVTAIKASLDIMADGTAGPISEDQKKIIATAANNVKRMSRLINDILDLSKYESGKMSIEPRPSDLGQLTQEAIQSVSSWAKTKNVKLDWRAAPELPLAAADPDRILQVFVNLLSNAIKFTPSGGQIYVEIDRDKSNPQESVKIMVRDTGPGIPEKDLKRIFEKFVQVESSKASIDVKGTGLGLPIAQVIVQLHKGNMWVESEVGKGTSFFFTLPAVKLAPQKPTLDKTASSQKTPQSKAFFRKLVSWFTKKR